MAEPVAGADATGRPQARGVPRPEYLKVLSDILTLKMTIGTLAVIGIGLAIIGVTYTPTFGDPNRSWVTFAVREVGSGLLVVAIANVVLQVFIERYRRQISAGMDQFIRDDVADNLQSIRTDIRGQAQVLLDGSATLAALTEVGVSRAFGSRGDATGQLLRDLQAREVTRIDIMGISLNDFLRSDQHQSLHGAWKVVTSYAKGERTPANDLAIRVLAIDPNCLGALLRSYGEAREDDQLAGRLDEDVTATARRLNDLAAETRAIALRAEEGESRVTFEFRLYRLPPTTFLCSTDDVSYVQPYYFWSRRQFDVTMPLLRLQGTPLHAAMQDHFDLIWHMASVPGDAWADARELGIDKGAYESGVSNIFTESEAAHARMCWLIKNARERVWVQGISLKSFFVPGKLQAALRSALRRDEVDSRILLLDPSSEQAKFRSFREHEFADHCEARYESFGDYAAAEDCHSSSTLVRDTQATINRLRRSLAKAANADARLYRTAPSCFILIVDDRVLVEQYHFGKAVPPESRVEDQETPPILGKDMALVEYARTSSALVEVDESRHPCDLLEDHFRFVWEDCSVPALTTATYGSSGEVPVTGATA